MLRSTSRRTRSSLSARPTRSRAPRGSRLKPTQVGPIDLGTKTSWRGNLSASMTASDDLLGGHGLEHRALHEPRRELRLDDSRHHDGDLHPGAAQLRPNRLRQPDDAMLGRAVRGEVRKAGLAGAGGDIDDVARPAGLHPAHGLLGAVDHAVEVDLEDADRGRVVLLVERPDRHDARVVDEHVDRPEPALDLVQEGGEAGAVGHVEREAHGVGPELGGRGLRGGGVDVADRHAAALARERECQRLADSPSAAGDDGDPAEQRTRLLGHGQLLLLSRRGVSE